MCYNCNLLDDYFKNAFFPALEKFNMHNSKVILYLSSVMIGFVRSLQLHRNDFMNE